MRNTTCQKAFEQGKNDRKARPLHSGAYKLQDCIELLEDCHSEIGRIRKYVSGEAPHTILWNCTASDKHSWLKELPQLVAYHLSYELLPGLAALENDGADPDEIASAFPVFERDCLELLGRFEAVRLTIQDAIKVEYAHMKAGDSLLGPLITEAIQLANRALSVVDATDLER